MICHTSNDIDRVKSLYAEGYSIERIASVMYMSYGTTRNLLIKNGVKIRKPNDYHTSNKWRKRPDGITLR